MINTVCDVQGFTSNAQGIGNDCLAKIFTLAGKIANQGPGFSILTSVRVQATGNSVIFTATDGHRLVQIECDMPECGEWVCYPVGKELAKAASLIRGQLSVGFTIDANYPYVVVSTDKGSVRIKCCVEGKYPNVDAVLDYSSIRQNWPDRDIKFNGSLLGQTLTLVSDLIDPKSGGVVTVDRLLPHFSVTAERAGISVRAILMPVTK